MKPAELVAASICWLSRWRGPMSSTMVLAKAERLHPDRCRFCTVPMESLIRDITADRALIGSDPAFIDFEKLNRRARFARVRQEQEDNWWETQ